MDFGLFDAEKGAAVGGDFYVEGVGWWSLSFAPDVVSAMWLL